MIVFCFLKFGIFPLGLYPLLTVKNDSEMTLIAQQRTQSSILKQNYPLLTVKNDSDQKNTLPQHIQLKHFHLVLGYFEFIF